MEYNQTCIINNIQITKFLDEFVNCPTPRYTTLCCHSRRQLLTSILQIQVGTLCACSKQHQLHWIWLQDMLFYVCKRYYLSKHCCWRVEMVRDGKTKCKIAQLVIFLMWMIKLTLFFVVVLIGLWCMLCGQFLGTTTMFMCDQCSRGWHMGCLTPPLNEILVKSNSSFGAWHKPKDFYN
jgi:hypothetical protein